MLKYKQVQLIKIGPIAYISTVEDHFELKLAKILDTIDKIRSSRKPSKNHSKFFAL